VVLRLKVPPKRSVFKLFLKNLEATRKDHHHGCFQQAFNRLFSSPYYVLKFPISLLEVRLFFNLSMMEGSLFCFVVMRSTEPEMLQIVFLVSLESSWRQDKRGAWALVPWCLDLWCKSSWILNDFFIEN